VVGIHRLEPRRAVERQRLGLAGAGVEPHDVEAKIGRHMHDQATNSRISPATAAQSSALVAWVMAMDGERPV